MNRKSRYSLLAFGFLVFILAAPLIVLYVRGVGFDFKTRTFVKTGIISVSSEPNNSDIYINGGLKRQSAGDIKFVLPGEYQVDIKKDGYFPWSKRLTVNAGEVTWASPDYNKIYLFLKDAAAKTISSNVLDFYYSGNKFFVLEKSVFAASNLNSLTRDTGYPLPKSVDMILAHDDSNANFVLTDSKATSSRQTLLLLNANTGLFTDLSGMFSSVPKLQFNGQDLYALDNGSLFQITASGKAVKPVAVNLDSFYFQSGGLYYIQTSATSSSLRLATNVLAAPQVLLAGLPVIKNSALLVTPQKQIFILEQGALYMAGSVMQKLADNVSQWSFDPNTSVLSVLHSGEMDYFDRLGNTLNFVTRSTSQISNPIIKTNIGNAFYLNQGSISSIELDSRSSQNQNVLYSGAADKFFVDDAAKTIFLLDSGQLKSLTIR